MNDGEVNANATHNRNVNSSARVLGTVANVENSENIANEQFDSNNISEPMSTRAPADNTSSTGQNNESNR